MEATKKKLVLKLASLAGELMMKNGAEVTRVEDTIHRICSACGVDHVEIFAVPTGVFVSIEPDETDGEVLTYIRRLHNTTTDLRKIHDLNQFSRTFTSTNMTVEEGLAELERIEQQPSYPTPLILGAAALAAGAFGAIYSGSVATALLTAAIAVICELFYLFLGHLETNYFIKGMLCCAIATALAIGCRSLGWMPGIGAAVIGVLMLYTPGAALTNSIRDLLSGDTLSGLTRLAETALIALSLATGAGIVLRIWSLAGSMTAQQQVPISLPVMILLGALSVPGFSILFHLPAKCMIPALVTGCAGWTVYQLLSLSGHGSAISVFFGAVFVGGFSRIFAKLIKAPETTFIIPGIIPLVPGALTFYTMQAFLLSSIDEGFSFFMQSVSSAGMIALGLLAIGTAAQIVNRIHHRILRPDSRQNDDPDIPLQV